MESLECGKQALIILFLYKLLNGDINCEVLLFEILFKIPSRVTPSGHKFMDKYHHTSYISIAFCDKLTSNFNKLDECFIQGFKNRPHFQ